MPVCKHCSGWGGYHTRYCSTRYSERFDRVASDPDRVERRKSIQPALTVPRNRPANETKES